ncbi:MAG: DUF4145 domain-containing protein [Candidatus Izemoplasmatales bacterium]|nr:DUF4145 domain-containing protein [Candidatus Izemoplasmatales bacterium]
MEPSSKSTWRAYYEICPACKNIIVDLITDDYKKSISVYPRTSGRTPCSIEVPQKLKEDYEEAGLILKDSPKASAALSRRCLQSILRDYALVKKSDLINEIQEVIDSNKLPSHLSENLDYIREIGNFAAHPNKNKNTGEISDVEKGEAEWCLDVLESLFDFYFVQPSISKKKKDALNNKLKEVGKQPIK